MSPDLKNLAAAVHDWATAKYEIGEVWFFGSRVRGTHRPDSDLDVAVTMRDRVRPQGERLAGWIMLSRNWKSELQAILPIKLDLQLGDHDISEDVVGPALMREGVKIYSRQD